MALKSSTVCGLRIVSFNCRSVKTSLTTVKELCDKNDLILLQEHWLMADEIGVLSNIHKDFFAFGSSAIDVSKNIL